jgi:hypothetical protein
MQSVVNHDTRGTEPLGASSLGFEGASSARNDHVLFVEVSNVFYVHGSNGIKVVGGAFGFVAEEYVRGGGFDYGIGWKFGGEFGCLT